MLHTRHGLAGVLAALVLCGTGPLAAEAWRAAHPTDLSAAAVASHGHLPDHVVLRGYAAGSVGPYLALAATPDEARVAVPVRSAGMGAVVGAAPVLVQGVGTWNIARGAPVAFTGRLERAWPAGLGIRTSARHVLLAEAGVAPGQWLRALMALGVAVGVLVASGAGESAETEELLPGRPSTTPGSW